MKKLTAKKRKELEEKWQAYSYREGLILCFFLTVHAPELKRKFKSLWETSDHIFISDYYFEEEYACRYDKDLAYLCRALTLNMFLDDCMSEG